MVNSCCAVDCTNRFQKGNGRGFFKFPRDLPRRDKWINALKRKSWVPSKSSVICGDHFQTGKPSSDKNHPDYVPNVFSFNAFPKGNAYLYDKRKRDLAKRSIRKLPVKRKNTEALIADVASVSTQVLEDFHNKAPSQVADDFSEEYPRDLSFLSSEVSEEPNPEFPGDFPLSAAEVSRECNLELPGDFSLSAAEVSREPNLEFPGDAHRVVLSALEKAEEKIKKLEEENRALKKELGGVDFIMEMHVLREENRCLKLKLEETNPTLRILMNVKSLKYHTGIINIDVFNWITSICKELITDSFKTNTDTQLLIVLIKLRLGIENADLALRFNISPSTVSRILDSWLPILSGRLKHLIKFPSHEKIRDSLPESFKMSKYSETTCILDCTEVLTQRPPNLKNKNLMWSNYKHHQTMKILIGIIPNGQIAFISECWGGRVSDKEITLKSGIMDNFKPGDVILADRGFNLKDEFAAQGITLIIPTFTKGKTQLTKKEVSESQKISNIRIHVERVIGQLKCFKILKNIMPISFLKYANYAVITCAALVNLAAPIVN